MGPTNIEWCDATWNVVGGCTIRSPGCKNCYAQDLAGTRLINHPLYAGTTTVAANGKPVFNGKMTVAPDDHPVWTRPLKWRGAKNRVMGAGMPSLIFVGDMSDLFHEERPAHVIAKVFAVMARCPHHVFQVLTKRPERMRDWILTIADSPDGIFDAVVDLVDGDREEINRIGELPWPLPNVWCGTSVERQKEADERIPLLLQTPAAVRFISAEPLIGPIDLHDWLTRDWHPTMPPETTSRLDWVIVGGESGPDRRPTDIAWMHSLRDQCLAAGVSYFHKQMTGKKAIPPDLQIRQFPAVKPLPVAAGAPRAPEPQMRLI
jgi:protein gp37